jgi:hypothetical protein
MPFCGPAERCTAAECVLVLGGSTVLCRCMHALHAYILFADMKSATVGCLRKSAETIASQLESSKREFRLPFSAAQHAACMPPHHLSIICLMLSCAVMFCHRLRDWERPLQAGSSGPPYGLLQGVCARLEANASKEQTTQIKCGPHCIMHAVRDFGLPLASAAAARCDSPGT